MIQALIFDFDGLILDTEMSALQSWAEIYKEYNCEIPMAKWMSIIGGTAGLFDPLDYLEQQIGRPVEREALLTRRRLRHEATTSALSALPGVEDYLSDARRLGLKIGLASSSSRRWVQGHLTRLGLMKYFDCLRCADDVAHKKPDPELYLAALQGLGVEAGQAVALEDSPNGVTAAQRAGIFCVAIPNALTGQLPLDHADLHLTSLAEMPLERLLARVEQRRRA
jgi:HAD superfamily hydrolase (TIGR01509 family)